MNDKSQKTEKPTPKRVQKARDDGQFLTSKDFTGALQFLAFVAMLAAWGGEWFEGIKSASYILIAHSQQNELTPARLTHLASVVLGRAFLPLGFAGLILVIVTIGVQAAVSKGGVSFKKLQPSFRRLNPINNFKEVGRQGIPSLLQAFFVILLFGALVYLIARDEFQSLFMLPMAPLDRGIETVSGSILELLWKAAGVFVVFGCIDLFRQHRRYSSELKMSKQEIKDELKDSDGNPQIKMRVRRLQRELLRRRMMSEVATATAVVVNPTHFAVAIRYKPETMAAPMVVAKGKNYLALRIRQRAIENQVALVENPPLAQALYKSVEVGQEIPPHLYRAVAEILAYVFRLMDPRLRM